MSLQAHNKRERKRKSDLVVVMNGASTRLRDPETGKYRNFTFDFSYWSHDGSCEDENGCLVKDVKDDNADIFSGQIDVYNDLGKGVLKNAWNGYNTTLFAYGQTGSGKSWSMVGYGSNPGIVPIFCEAMFKEIDEKRKAQSQDDKKTEYQVLFSMLEIYMEEVRDLVNTKNNSKGGLKIRQHPKRGFYADGLTQVAVVDYNDIAERMATGTEARTVASTAMNATSSRAHTIVGITLVQRTSRSKTGAETTAKTSVVNLVDLAGSERASNTGATGARLKEGSAINQSLSALGNCIAALADRSAGKRVRVPFRNSSLTKLLKNALGGNSKTIMIAAISPADINYEESLSTLRYADRAKQIKTIAKVNEDPTEKLIRELNEENKKLKEMLAQASKGKGKSMKRTLERPDDESDTDDDEENNAVTEQDKAAIRAEVEAEYKLAVQQNSREMAALKKTFSEKIKEAKTDNDTQAKKRKEQMEKRNKYHHLVNVNMDPQLTGKIIHYLIPTKQIVEANTTVVESEDKEASKEDQSQIKRTSSAVKQKDVIKLSLGNKKGGDKDVVLSGPNIKPMHAIFEIKDSKFSLQLGDPDAKLVLNGDDFEPGESRILNDKDWILFGTTQLYVYRVPVKKGVTDVIPNIKFEDCLEEIEDFEDKQDATNNSSQLFEGCSLSEKEMKYLKEQLLDIRPRVDVANDISSEMNAGVLYELCVLNARHFGRKNGNSQLYIRGSDIRATHASHEWIWSVGEFAEQVCLMESAFSKFEVGDPINGDPFRRDMLDDSLIGSAEVWLGSLAYGADTAAQELHLINSKGRMSGQLCIDLTPCMNNGNIMDSWVDSPLQLLGNDYHFNVNLEYAKDIPKRFTDIYAEYRIKKSMPKKIKEKIKKTKDSSSEKKSSDSEENGSEGFFEKLLDSSDSSSSSEDEEGDSDKIISVFTNRMDGVSNDDELGRTTVTWKHGQRFDFTCVSQETLDSLKNETVFVRVWGRQRMAVAENTNANYTRKVMRRKQKQAHLTTIDYVEDKNSMELNLSEKRVDKYEHKIENIRKMLTLAEDHNKPRLSLEIINELLKAKNEKESNKILAKVKDEKVVETAVPAKSSTCKII